MADDASQNDDISTFITLFKMGLVVCLLCLGCLSMCLGSISLTLLRLRWSQAIKGATRKQYNGARETRHHGHSMHHKSMNTHARNAIAVAEQACNVAFKRIEERLSPPVSPEVPRRCNSVVEVQPQPQPPPEEEHIEVVVDKK